MKEKGGFIAGGERGMAAACGSYPGPDCSAKIEMAVADLRMAVMWAEICASNARHQIETGGGWLCDFNARMNECQVTVDLCKKRIAELMENASAQESAFELLKAVHDWHESGMVHPHPDGPGHSHSVKGIRDADGLPCQWCAIWEKVRKMCGGAGAPTQNTTVEGRTAKGQQA